MSNLYKVLRTFNIILQIKKKKRHQNSYIANFRNTLIFKFFTVDRYFTDYMYPSLKDWYIQISWWSQIWMSLRSTWVKQPSHLLSHVQNIEQQKGKVLTLYIQWSCKYCWHWGWGGGRDCILKPIHISVLIGGAKNTVKHSLLKTSHSPTLELAHFWMGELNNVSKNNALYVR